MRTTRLKARPGFTLIEAVVVLSLLGTLVYMGASSLLSLIPKYKLESAMWDIRSTLNAARYKAVFENASIRVRFGSGQWEMEKYDAARKAWISCRRRSVDGVRVEANNSPLFTAQGTVSGLATITIANSWGAYKITLAISGRIKTARVS
jgi:prepilin-type N-terminal cleavage/methylation domain-containing protein